MRILAIESSSLVGSVALGEGAQVVGKADLPSGRRTAKTLLPTIGELLDTAGWSPETLELVAVVAGPGSFTGLREIGRAHV